MVAANMASRTPMKSMKAAAAATSGMTTSQSYQGSIGDNAQSREFLERLQITKGYILEDKRSAPSYKAKFWWLVAYWFHVSG